MRIEYGGPDKVQVLPGPVMQPAKCILCGAPGDGRPFIDIGCYLDWYGAVYFCGYCIVEISNKLGYVSPDQAEVVQRNLSAALSENHILAEQDEHLRSIVNNLLDFTISERNNFVHDYQEFIAWRSHQTTIEDIEPEGQTDIGTNVEDSEQGSSDVSNDGDNESELGLGIDFSGVYGNGRSE
jgi:hypothetical protein